MCPLQCGFRATFFDSVMHLTFDLRITYLFKHMSYELCCLHEHNLTIFIYFRTTVLKLERKTQSLHFILAGIQHDILSNLVDKKFMQLLT